MQKAMGVFSNSHIYSTPMSRYMHLKDCTAFLDVSKHSIFILLPGPLPSSMAFHRGGRGQSSIRHVSQWNMSPWLEQYMSGWAANTCRRICSRVDEPFHKVAMMSSSNLTSRVRDSTANEHDGSILWDSSINVSCPSTWVPIHVRLCKIYLAFITDLCISIRTGVPASWAGGSSQLFT